MSNKRTVNPDSDTDPSAPDVDQQDRDNQARRDPNAKDSFGQSTANLDPDATTNPVIINK